VVAKDNNVIMKVVKRVSYGADTCPKTYNQSPQGQNRRPKTKSGLGAGTHEQFKLKVGERTVQVQTNGCKREPVGSASKNMYGKGPGSTSGKP